jgi:hypothetical protein
MSEYDIHSCGYYCNRPACIEAQRNELRDKLFAELPSVRVEEFVEMIKGKENFRGIPVMRTEWPLEDRWVKTYSGGKPNYTQPDEAMMKRVMDGIPDMPIKAKIEKEPTIDGWPLWSGLPPIKVQDKTFEEFAQSFAQSARVNGIPEPEPVAYINVEKRELEWAKLTRWETPTVAKMDKVPLYTAKEWVGLTLDEIDDIGVRFALMRGGDIDAKDWFDFYKAIEAKLKEKNT